MPVSVPRSLPPAGFDRELAASGNLAARLSGHWLALRDKLLGDARFQRWAARFPLTRRIATRESRALFDICAGFVYAQVLAACVELDLFDKLASGPQTTQSLAAHCALDDAAMRRLLRAAASLRLLQQAGADRFRLGPLGAAMRGNPGIAAMVRHHALFYADMASPVSLLRDRAGTQLAGFWPYAGRPGEGAAYSALMAASLPMVSSEILARYDFSAHRCLLDIGGGDGSFLRAVASRAPALQLRLFDLPAVAALAEPAFAAAKLAGRATAHGGDFRHDPLPTGADIISLVRVLHDHDDETALILLRAARAALPPGGTILIAEPMAGQKGAEPIGDAYFGFYLWAVGTGRARHPAEIENLLRRAGFGTIRQVATSQKILTGLITARADHV